MFQVNKRCAIARLVVASLALIAVATPAAAAQFCVGTAAQLRDALTTAASNGADDEIRLGPGTYAPTDGTTAFTYSTTENFALTISGNWSVAGMFPCLLQFDGLDSTLDGLDARRVMRLNGGSGFGAITLTDLTFANGDAVGTGGGLSIGNAAFRGNVVIERVTFRGNVASSFGGGLWLITQGDADIRSSVFSRNRSANNYAAAHFDLTGSNYFPPLMFANNTVVGNGPTANAGGGFDTGGIHIQGPNLPVVINNAFHANVGADVDNEATNMTLSRNNIAVVVSPPYDASTNYNFPDPGFVNAAADPADLHLRDDSPLRQRGTSAFGLAAYDRDREPRVVGGVVDIGAYENLALIFSHGFEN